MTSVLSSCPPALRRLPGIRDRTGFSLIEFMVASLILLLIAGAALEILSRAQRTVASQADMQEILDNARFAMDSVTRILRQAANDPLGAGFDGITIVSAYELRVRSDLTGSAGTSNPDKGDPDGDVDDASEDVTIRFNGSDRTIELIPAGGSAQAIGSNISAFSMQYMNSDGAETPAASEIRKIRVTLAATGSLPDPQTRQYLSIRMTSDVRLATRR